MVVSSGVAWLAGGVALVVGAAGGCCVPTAGGVRVVGRSVCGGGCVAGVAGCWVAGSPGPAGDFVQRFGLVLVGAGVLAGAA